MNAAHLDRNYPAAAAAAVEADVAAVFRRIIGLLLHDWSWESSLLAAVITSLVTVKS